MIVADESDDAPEVVREVGIDDFRVVTAGAGALGSWAAKSKI